MDTAQTPFVGVVILAAGRSRRMGRPKLLLPWGNTSILGHLLHIWRALHAIQISVVVATDDNAVSAELDRLNVPEQNRVPNPAPDTGMFSSVQLAARWAAVRNATEPALTHYAVGLGDQPHLRLEVLSRLLLFAAEHRNSICQPSYHGRGRHPVIFPKEIFHELADSEAPTLREFLVGHGVRLLECDEPGLDLDIDTPADYERACAMARATE